MGFLSTCATQILNLCSRRPEERLWIWTKIPKPFLIIRMWKIWIKTRWMETAFEINKASHKESIFYSKDASTSAVFGPLTQSVLRFSPQCRSMVSWSKAITDGSEIIWAPECLQWSRFGSNAVRKWSDSWFDSTAGSKQKQCSVFSLLRCLVAIFLTNQWKRFICPYMPVMLSFWFI